MPRSLAGSRRRGSEDQRLRFYALPDPPGTRGRSVSRHGLFQRSTRSAYRPPRSASARCSFPGRGCSGPPRDHDEAVAVIRRAREHGVDHIDTASYYGPDVANQLLREALDPWPSDLKIVSKVGARREADGRWLPALAPDEVRAAVAHDLETLGIDRLTAVNLRLLDTPDDVFLDALERWSACATRGRSS